MRPEDHGRRGSGERRRRRRPRRRRGGTADRISDLPDHLLHRILICLPSADYAARTSVLSRRWRRVWTHLPELAFRYGINPRRVDAALAAWSAPVLHRLKIGLSWFYSRVITTGHVCSWLRFASQHLAGELHVCQRLEIEEVVLPVCPRFTAVSLEFVEYTPRLRFQAGGGVFTALAALTIKNACLENRELEELVSSRCPLLKELDLEDITLLSRHQILSIRSDSLEKLRVVVDSLEKLRLRSNYNGGASNATGLFDAGGSLQVATPELQDLSMGGLWGDAAQGTEAHIAAPKLSKVYWREFYDPRSHRLVMAGRHLKRLELSSRSLALFRRFDAVEELHLDISLPEGAEEYMRILEDASKIRCEVLVVTFLATSHAFQPIMLHLLRTCVGIRKLVVGFHTRMPYLCKSSKCPCKLMHNHLTNGIFLDSLQEVVVERAGEEKQIVELVDLLCRCSEAMCQKKVHITISQGNSRLRSIDMRAQIDTLLSATNSKVEVTIS